MKLKMGDAMRKIKQKHLETKCKIRAYVYRVVMFTLLPMVMPAVAFADNTKATDAPSDATTVLSKVTSGLESVKTVFATIVGIIGAIVLVWQIVEVANGVRSGETQQVTSGIKGIIAGGIMAAAGALVNIFV